MKRGRWSEWLAVVILAGGCGLAAWYAFVSQPAEREDPAASIVNAPMDATTVALPMDAETALAYRYATAVQEGRCEDIVALTWWMQERLARVASDSPGGEAGEAERLCRLMTERRVERNRLTPEGVGDEYVFCPGATITAYGHDPGQSGLAKATSRRIWLKVTYPSPERALLDESGRPLRSIVAGVNLSADGYVLKANVSGNLDIDRNSADTNWQL